MTLHDPGDRTGLQERIRRLRPDTERKWGRMSAAQMLWHVNQAMETALGRVTLPTEKVPLPRPIMKFIVINLPWPKGAPTVPGFVAKGESFDFEAERDRCLRLIDQVAATSLDGEWAPSPVFGRMKGKEVTTLQAKHLNHHLTQFGV
jgi:Protein of unknown function (DUF1569)